MFDLGAFELRVFKTENLEQVALIDNFQKLDAVGRFTDVGTWILDMPYNDPVAPYLAPGYGLEIVLNKQSIFSGPVWGYKRHFDGAQDVLTVNGFDHNMWLLRRVASPQPTTAAPPYNTDEFHTVTDICSSAIITFVDYNLGDSALAVRQLPHLTFGDDPGAGASRTGSARWQTLLELIQGLAIQDNLGFGITKQGTDLVFEVYEPVDRTNTVVLSNKLGTLQSFDYEVQGPTISHDFVGGAGQGTARSIVEQENADNLIRWGRLEAFTGGPNSTDAAELNQAGTKALSDGGQKTSVNAVAVDTEGLAFRSDYNLGDQVSANLDGIEYADVIREVHITLDADRQQVTPTIGTQNVVNARNQIFDKLAGIIGRVQNLERT